jgi:hypothetical protein
LPFLLSFIYRAAWIDCPSIGFYHSISKGKGLTLNVRKAIWHGIWSFVSSQSLKNTDSPSLTRYQPLYPMRDFIPSPTPFSVHPTLPNSDSRHVSIPQAPQGYIHNIRSKLFTEYPNPPRLLTNHCRKVVFSLYLQFQIIEHIAVENEYFGSFL